MTLIPTLNSRAGYAADFLTRPVALPTLTPDQLDDAVRLIDQPDQVELKYQHFSLVMSRSRRLPFFTAVNIDGQQIIRLKREQDRWQYDSRIPKKAQLGPAFYRDVDLDFGHLVRRLDPSWGDTDTVQIANDDTFYFTNCAPQHKALNRNKSTWAGLEDYILQQAVADQDRLTVFTGPLFGPTDPLFRGGVVARAVLEGDGVTEAGWHVLASAYLLSQYELVKPLLDPSVPKTLSDAEAQSFQIPVYRLERLTRLTFDDLVRHDPLLSRSTKGLAEDVPGFAITDASDMQV